MKNADSHLSEPTHRALDHLERLSLSHEHQGLLSRALPLLPHQPQPRQTGIRTISFRRQLTQRLVARPQQPAQGGARRQSSADPAQFRFLRHGVAARLCA